MTKEIIIYDNTNHEERYDEARDFLFGTRAQDFDRETSEDVPEKMIYDEMSFIYQKYPVRERKTNRPFIDAVWEIQPITKKEIMRSILDELPFLKHLAFLFYFHFFNVLRKIFHFFPKT